MNSDPPDKPHAERELQMYRAGWLAALAMAEHRLLNAGRAWKTVAVLRRQSLGDPEFTKPL